MTLTLNLATWFKVTAYPLPRGTSLVKYDLNWAKGQGERRYTPDEQKDRRMDRWNDRLITIGRCRAGPVYL